MQLLIETFDWVAVNEGGATFFSPLREALDSAANKELWQRLWFVTDGGVIQ